MAALVLNAAGLALRVEILLRRNTPLPVITAALGLSDEPGGHSSGRPPAWKSRERLRAVNSLFDVWPATGTCLRRSLVQGYLLRELRPVLRVGVRHDASGQLLAHAWVEIDGKSLDSASTEYVALPLDQVAAARVVD